MIDDMGSTIARTQAVGRAAARWGETWWHIIHLGALVAALAMSPSAWRGTTRRSVARHVWQGSGPLLPWFAVLSALVSLVIIRIVIVTAQSYGLSRYALEMVVRVLVLELIPLTAALFVALRVTIPWAVELAQQRFGGALGSMRRAGIDVLREAILPRVVGGFFAVLLLATVSGTVCLVLAYLLVHGFSPWGLERYTRLVGHVFNPVVSLIFMLKTMTMALAVSIIPIGSALHDRPSRDVVQSQELRGLVRMFAAILLIEVASLVGNYT